MTLETPLHLQSRRLVSDWHLIDAAMTRRATDPFVHMNAVIEISIVWKIVNSDPLHRPVRAQTCPNRLQVGAVSPDLFVTAHAGFGGRHAGKRGVFNRAVTVAAVDAVIADVMLMTKLNRLLALDPSAGVPGGSIKLGGHPECRKQNEDCAKDTQLGQGIGAVMENLWHRRSLLNVDCEIRQSKSS